MAENANSASSSDCKKTWREADNILERIALYAQQNPGSPVYTIPDESQAQQLLTALSAIYNQWLTENPPDSFEVMASAQQSMGEMDQAVRQGVAFDYLANLLTVEPLSFYGVEIDVSRVVVRQ